MLCFCQFNTQQSHLTRGIVCWGVAVIRLACGQACGSFSLLMTRVGGPTQCLLGKCPGECEKTDGANRGDEASKLHSLLFSCLSDGVWPGSVNLKSRTVIIRSPYFLQLLQVTVLPQQQKASYTRLLGEKGSLQLSRSCSLASVHHTWKRPFILCKDTNTKWIALIRRTDFWFKREVMTHSVICKLTFNNYSWGILCEAAFSKLS